MEKKFVNITIDGKPILAEEGRNIVEVAKDNHIDIPSLCYYPNIDPPLGSCRVCTVNANGKPVAACTTRVREGMDIDVHTPELIDCRKALVEMMYAEGNHFCPSCEKSGDCDLQGLGYRMGVTVSRFPHLFVDRVVDYNPKRIVIEHNRCIRCRRCVEEVLTDDGQRVFSFHHRGNTTEVAVDYALEATLSQEQAIQAMNICPVGAILVRGKSMARPRGERKYDKETSHTEIPHTSSPPQSPTGRKKIIATTSLAGCFGCHMSMLDIDLEIAELIELVDISKSPLTDIKHFNQRCDIGIIEGGCCNSDNIEVLKAFRKNCDVLIATGECAIWGGLPAMRNFLPLEDCLTEAYTSADGTTSIPHHPDLPEILDRVYACNEVVKIDYYIPGCPPDASHIWKVIKNILLGQPYTLTQNEFKYD
jgi:coenzyme F420-reducing hydrogenase gamma subunit/ferredoxin